MTDTETGRSLGTDQIGRLVTQAAARHPELLAVKTTDGLALTYGELDERSTRLADALLASGLAPGDRIAAWLDTCPQYIELYFAVAKAGLVLVPVNSMFTEEEAAYILADSEAAVLFHLPDRAEPAARLAEKYGLMQTIAVAHWRETGSPYERLLRSGAAELPALPSDESLYVIAYTSGTTGRPKGAMVTHRSLKNTLRHHAHAYRTPQYSVCIYHSNMSFVATVLGLIMGHIYLCGTIVITGKVDPSGLLDVIDSERGTFTFVPSPWIKPMTDLAAAHPEKWQHMLTFVHTASKANPDHLRAWAEVVGHRYLEGWGMSEASGGLVTVTDVVDVLVGSSALDFFASAGRPVVDTVIRVIDADGEELPHDGLAVGELVVQSPALVTGYWNNPEATRAALRGGWYHTGDLGSIDPAGYVYVTERRTDLIVSGGMNVYPSEIERSLSLMEGVHEVAVIGVPHERWGQTPVAIIVADRAAGLTAAAVIEHCRRHIARYKSPSRVEFVDTMPRTASNKILKRVLRERFGQQ